MSNNANHAAAWKAIAASRDAIRAQLEQPRKPMPRRHVIEMERHTRSFPKASLRQSDQHLFAAVRPC